MMRRGCVPDARPARSYAQLYARDYATRKLLLLPRGTGARSPACRPPRAPKANWRWERSSWRSSSLLFRTIRTRNPERISDRGVSPPPAPPPSETPQRCALRARISPTYILAGVHLAGAHAQIGSIVRGVYDRDTQPSAAENASYVMRESIKRLT